MGDVVASSPTALASARTAVRETRESLASVFGNPGLRRINLALAGSMVGDWAYATAVTVWAYQVGGATAVGIWGAIRLTLMALTAPIASTLADRLPRKRVMVGADAVRAALVTGAAVCLYAGVGPAAVFVLATATSLLGTPFRAAQAAMLPSLARHPEELTAGNGVASTIESISFFIGPAIGASLIALTGDVELVFLVNAATFLWSMVMVLGVRPAEKPSVGPVAAEEPATDPEEAEGFVAQTMAGFRHLFTDRDLLVVALLVSAQTVVAGASLVFTVLIAVDVLGTGPHGVGYLDSMLGVGAIVGGFVAIARSSRHRLGQDLATGVVLWSLPLLLIAIWPSPLTAFAAMALLGLANPLVDVNMATIVQRITPDAVLGRVFGAFETCLIATMALGSFVMPFLVAWVGFRMTLAVVAVSVTAVVLPCLPRVRHLDATLLPPAGLTLLRAVPMFVPLQPSVLETLARQAGRLEVPAGTTVLSEGADSDRFFVIESGLVDVTRDGVVLRQEGPGDFFGEIGLLRDVPRTATITAVSDTVLVTLDRDGFLAAVTGSTEASMTADDIVSRRMTV